MVRRNPEEYIRYWSAAARVYAERRREEMAERLAAMAASTHALTAALVMTNVLNVLQLVPEFWVMLSRFSELIMLPPELVRELYPELYSGLILASSLSTTAQIVFEVTFSSARRQLMPVFKGAWRLAFASLFLLSLLTNALAAHIAKAPAAILNAAILSISMPLAFSSRYDRISEEVNRAQAGGGA
ncbi:MAG: hypothetical protein ABWK00_05840 [Desulfurococcaceae archaeon]